MKRSLPRPLARIPLAAPDGSPIDLWRTFVSHGVASLPPMSIDEDERTLEVTLPLPRARPRTVRLSQDAPGHALVEGWWRPPGPAALGQLLGAVRHVLRFDEDLGPFYAVAQRDPELRWVAAGAGRMIQSPTVFEDVVKTVCTTNCSWALTRRMVSALVEHLGAPAPGAPPAGPEGRAFPTPEAMAARDLDFYREVVRSGYRAPYLLALARAVSSGEVDLESLRSPEISDDEVEARLLALPGVGPYAAAHVMLLLGRYSRLILDSWTRPTYARIVGRRAVSDAAIARRFKRFGPYAGLAFWLFITSDWVAEPAEQQADAYSGA